MKRAFSFSLYLSLPLCLIFSTQSSCQNSKDIVQQTAGMDNKSFTAEKLYEELKNPWAMAFLPDGRMLITERSGEILIFKNDKYTGERKTEIQGKRKSSFHSL